MEMCCQEIAMNLDIIDSKSCGIMDENTFNDNRVLEQLLKDEERFLPLSLLCTYKTIQSEIRPEMRKLLSFWMLDVCEELKCEEIVFPLAISYVDRFLSTTNIKKTQLQLLGASCLLIASKLRQCEEIHSDDLVHYSDYSLSITEILSWELLVLSRLKWDISLVVPTDFVDHLLIRLSLNISQLPNHHGSDKKLLETIRRHTSTFITLCSTDFKFSMFPPSMIAAACLGTALQSLIRSENQKRAQQQILEQLHLVTGIDVDCLRGCQEQIEEILASYRPNDNVTDNEMKSKLTDSDANNNNTINNNNNNNSNNNNNNNNNGTISVNGMKHCDQDDVNSKPETPTDIQNVNF